MNLSFIVMLVKGVSDSTIQCKYLFSIEEIKHKLSILEYFYTFILVFYVIIEVIRVFWYFHIFS
jgi:hypothetical protein